MLAVKAARKISALKSSLRATKTCPIRVHKSAMASEMSKRWSLKVMIMAVVSNSIVNPGEL